MFCDVNRLYIEKISLHHYRNYNCVDLFAGPHPIVLWGDNGSGKTNFLEALSLLSPGKGLRRALYDDLRPYDNKSREVFVHADLKSSSCGKISIGTGILSSDNHRKVKINNHFCKSQDLLNYCHVTWLLPSMDNLFTGASSERRKFLDRLVLASNKNHGQNTLNYEKSIKARNCLLQNKQTDKHYFLALEKTIAENAVLIASARLSFIEILSRIIEEIASIFSFPKAKLSLIGFLEEQLLSKSSYEVEEFYKEHLDKYRYKDIAAGRTLLGVHRSDLHVISKKKNMPAQLCSTGEQKSLLILLILAHVCLIREVVGITPFVLLDEVTAHLDSHHRNLLFSLLKLLQVQSVLTGTDRFLFEGLKDEAYFYNVKNGLLFLE